jgi:Ran GTPase-activating protein (RanGAP) involved in mRNA processing and transport
MRANSLTELDLKRKCVGVAGVMVMAGLIPVMGGLTALDLSSNDLEDEGVSAVCEAIQSHKETKLASLNMGKNPIGPVGAKSVAAMVAVMGALTSLDISNNIMGDDGVKPICEALKQNNSLKVLDLNASNTRGGNIGPQGAKYLADMLSVNRGLTSLNLSGNDLTNYGRDMTGIKKLAAALGVNGALTQVLDFRSPWISLFCSLTLALL